MLLKDESVNVVKKAILTLTQLYKVALQVNTVAYVLTHLQSLDFSDLPQRGNSVFSIGTFTFITCSLFMFHIHIYSSACFLPVAGALQSVIRGAGGVLGFSHTDERGRSLLAGL